MLTTEGKLYFEKKGIQNSKFWIPSKNIIQSKKCRVGLIWNSGEFPANSLTQQAFVDIIWLHEIFIVDNEVVHQRIFEITV